ncbi:unnamed protein product [Blepharisma stoltei]|uniref:Uncharacterized protein n=1 Tax=Blepharisma stoltei TaxID=1481888 RepID=A0AAU9JYA1_9CILI|nr:unnamed protein product [Blepharisma stoltei]
MLDLVLFLQCRIQGLFAFWKEFLKIRTEWNKIGEKSKGESLGSSEASFLAELETLIAAKLNLMLSCLNWSSGSIDCWKPLFPSQILYLVLIFRIYFY